MISKVFYHHLILYLLNLFKKKVNANGQIITSRSEIFNLASNHTIESTNHLNLLDRSDVFIDNHPKIFRNLIKIQRQKKFMKFKCQKKLFSNETDFNLVKQVLRNWKICCK